jgi:hypothetical protein
MIRGTPPTNTPNPEAIRYERNAFTYNVRKTKDDNREVSLPCVAVTLNCITSSPASILTYSFRDVLVHYLTEHNHNPVAWQQTKEMLRTGLQSVTVAFKTLSPRREMRGVASELN